MSGLFSLVRFGLIILSPAGGRPLRGRAPHLLVYAKSSVIVQFLFFWLLKLRTESGLVWSGLVWSGAENLVLVI